MLRAHYFCGEGEIRTLEDLSTLLVFETSAFDHSATSPFGHDNTLYLSGKMMYYATRGPIV